MLREWLSRRARRRGERLAATRVAVRERAYELVREVAAPLVEAGLARLEWTEPDPRDDWLADGAVELVPANERAAPVAVHPGRQLVSLNVGPRASLHELVIDPRGEWLRELRTCLEAVVEGRYRESATTGRVSAEVLTMTFEVPGGRDVVVTHHSLAEPDPDEPAPPAEPRFASYA